MQPAESKRARQSAMEDASGQVCKLQTRTIEEQPIGWADSGIMVTLPLFPNPSITHGSSQVGSGRALPQAANTVCGSGLRGSSLAQLVHPLGGKLQACRAYAQRAQTFPDRIAFAVRN